MVSIICTIIICATLYLSLQTVLRFFSNPEPQITEDDLNKAYKDAEGNNIPDFQDVIAYINKEFSGLEEEMNEER